MRLLVLSEQPLFSMGVCQVANDLDLDVEAVAFSELHPMSRYISAVGQEISLVLIDLPPYIQPQGRSLLVKFLNMHPSVPTAVLTDTDDGKEVRHLLDMGLRGVVTKSMDQSLVRQAIQLMLSGGRFVPEVLSSRVESFVLPASRRRRERGGNLDRLTPRQMDVLRELGRGRSNQEIASLLGIALATVKLHVNAVLSALGVRNRTEAAIIAHRAGLDELRDIA